MADEPAIAGVAAAPQVAAAPRGRRWRRPAWAAGLVVLVLVGAALLWSRLAEPPPVRYETVPAAMGDVTRSVAATGTVNPVLTIVIGSYTSGVIQSVSCDYNTEVKTGQLCASIDPRPYETVVAQCRANLAVAQAQLAKDRAALAYAKLNSDRNALLVQRQAVSQDTADLALSTYEQAEAQIGLDEATIQQRQAELDSAQVNLDYTSIRAPVDGTVVSRNVTQGQTVTSSFQTPTLFVIATDLTSMEVDTNVSESDIGGLAEDQAAEFTVDAFPGRVFPAKVTQVRQSPQTVQNVVTYDVVLGVDNHDRALMPGMTASVSIVADQRKGVLRVPNQALRYAPSGIAASPPEGAGITEIAANAGQIFVLRNGRPVRLAVIPGLADDSDTEIVKGDLKVGDQVITGEARPTAPAGAPALAPRL